jgi:hypothetical protein
METAADSRVCAESVTAFEGRRPEVKKRNSEGLRGFCSKLSFEKLLSALEVFSAPSHVGVSSIDDESRRRICDVAEKNLQLECDFGLLQQEVADLRGASSRLAGEHGACKQKWMLYKRHNELDGGSRNRMTR